MATYTPPSVWDPSTVGIISKANSQIVGAGNFMLQCWGIGGAYSPDGGEHWYALPESGGFKKGASVLSESSDDDLIFDGTSLGYIFLNQSRGTYNCSADAANRYAEYIYIKSDGDSTTYKMYSDDATTAVVANGKLNICLQYNHGFRDSLSFMHDSCENSSYKQANIQFPIPQPVLNPYILLHINGNHANDTAEWGTLYNLAVYDFLDIKIGFCPNLVLYLPDGQECNVIYLP
jgi:hypothetical protein